LLKGLNRGVRAMDRLMNEGLSRHDTLDAIGSVVAEHLFEAADAKTKDDPNAIQTRYNAAVERLSTKQWRKQYRA
jgi:hypothetical protein